MPIPFAALQTRVTGAIAEKLANETMTINAAAVDGILTNEYVTVEFVESKKPVFLCKSSEIVGIAHGDNAIASDSTAYKVRGIQQDGTGMTKLILELQ